MRLNVISLAILVVPAFLCDNRARAIPVESRLGSPLGSPQYAAELNESLAKTSLAATIRKAFIPKPASYHGKKAAHHIKHAGANAVLGGLALPRHALIGIGQGIMSTSKAMSSTIDGTSAKSGLHLANGVVQPAAGIIGGTYMTGKMLFTGAKDLGRSLYHATAYPVAKTHELIHGKPSDLRQAKYEHKLTRSKSRGIQRQAKLAEEYMGISEIKIPTDGTLRSTPLKKLLRPHT